MTDPYQPQSGSVPEWPTTAIPSDGVPQPGNLVPAAGFPPPTGQMPTAGYMPTAPLREVSIDHRRQTLAMAVAHEVARGARVESQTETMAIIVTGSKPNHVLHLILTLATCGFWGIGWLIVAAAQREHRASITVDPYGQLLRQQLS
ncbi:hypothetical protein OG225_41120 (plasmid) [Nocardia sp. NBC_01377]|uniref:hypothetical protein n=1 Tax=Nocardia sp. NBC_01377 TaxID=2903595 RepID=UPI002F90C876